MIDLRPMSRASRAVNLLRSRNLTTELLNRRRAKNDSPRHLLRNPMTLNSRTSARRINALYDGMPGARNYLEIGLWKGFTFEQVRVPIRVGVDPFPAFCVDSLPPNASLSISTSDEFFAGLDLERTFDLIFLDGLHTYRQSYADLINALGRCPDGVILLDDVIPSDEISALPDLAQSRAERERRGMSSADAPWHGDVFKVILAIREFHPELCVRTIVGSGNPQAVVWRPDGMPSTSAVDPSLLSVFDEVSFADVFTPTPPDCFVTCNEGQAIADALAAVSGRFDLRV